MSRLATTDWRDFDVFRAFEVPSMRMTTTSLGASVTSSGGTMPVPVSMAEAGELRFGALRSGSVALRDRVEEMLSRLPVVPHDEAVARSYATVRRALERAGTPIAAQALVDRRIVVTGNGRAGVQARGPRCRGLALGLRPVDR